MTTGNPHYATTSTRAVIYMKKIYVRQALAYTHVYMYLYEIVYTLS
jgi:hypothetical protein